MKVVLHETESSELIEAIISKASTQELPSKRDGWQFTWKKLGKTEGTDFYKLTTLDSPDEVEGILGHKSKEEGLRVIFRLR